MKAQSDSGQPLNVAFDNVKITPPLMSVSETIQNKYRVVFYDDGSYKENKKTGQWVDVRQQGSLYYPDQWVRAPEDLFMSPFVRQVAPQ